MHTSLQRKQDKTGKALRCLSRVGSWEVELDRLITVSWMMKFKGNKRLYKAKPATYSMLFECALSVEILNLCHNSKAKMVS